MNAKNQRFENSVTGGNPLRSGMQARSERRQRAKNQRCRWHVRAATASPQNRVMYTAKSAEPPNQRANIVGGDALLNAQYRRHA